MTPAELSVAHAWWLSKYPPVTTDYVVEAAANRRAGVGLIDLLFMVQGNHIIRGKTNVDLGAIPFKL